MTFQELEKICCLLWGRSWQSGLARNFNIDRRVVSKWKSRGVPLWVDENIDDVIRARLVDIHKAVDMRLITR